MILLDIIHNIALLVALSVAYGLLSERMRDGSPGHRVFSGILFGGVCIVGMMTPLRFAPGVIYDGRSIVLTVAAFVGGPATGVIAGVMAAAYRLWLGGIGTTAGVLTVAASVGLGVAFNLLRRRDPAWERVGRILILGILVHLLMLAAQLLIPGGVGIRAVMELGPVIIVLYSAAVVLISRIFIDREQRRRTRRALAESEERYRRLFEDSSAVMLVLDPQDGRIVDANPAAERFYGWSREQLTSKRVVDINISGTDEIEAEMSAARGGERMYFEFRHRRADGSVRDVEVFSGPVKVGGRDLLYSIIHDTTARKQAERSLALSSYCIENAVLDIIQARVRDARIVSANRQACNSLGYTEEELRRLTIFDIDPTFSLERWNGDGLSFKGVRRRKDGSTFPVEITVTLIEFDGEEYAFSFARDITARAHHEAELEASIREKEVLLKEIHHRVKNNLSVIASLLNLQRNRVESQEEALGALEKSRDRIATMAEIHMLLYETESFSAVDFSNYVDVLTRKLVSLYGGSKEIRLTLKLETVSLDITRAVPLALIVNEIVTNALKHAFVDRQTGHLGVELQPVSEELFRLAVWDDGPGCPDCTAPGEAPTLGLQLVRVLSEQLSARLAYDTDAGTRAEITFPIV
ncbi:MAG: PAS domain S-box protein [Spirochaetaceae bacterium]